MSNAHNGLGGLGGLVAVLSSSRLLIWILIAPSKVSILFSFCKWGSWGTERFSGLPKATQLRRVWIFKACTRFTLVMKIIWKRSAKFQTHTHTHAHTHTHTHTHTMTWPLSICLAGRSAPTSSLPFLLYQLQLVLWAAPVGHEESAESCRVRLLWHHGDITGTGLPSTKSLLCATCFIHINSSRPPQTGEVGSPPWLTSQMRKPRERKPTETAHPESQSPVLLRVTGCPTFRLSRTSDFWMMMFQGPEFQSGTNTAWNSGLLLA